VEIVRRTFERWNAGQRDIDPEVVNPEIVVISAMSSTTYRGFDGLRQWMAEIDDQFGDWGLSVDEFRDAPDARLLALGKVHIRGRSSGVEFDQPMGWLVTFAEGTVIELTTFPDHAQALDAAGLSE